MLVAPRIRNCDNCGVDVTMFCRRIYLWNKHYKLCDYCFKSARLAFEENKVNGD